MAVSSCFALSVLTGTPTVYPFRCCTNLRIIYLFCLPILWQAHLWVKSAYHDVSPLLGDPLCQIWNHGFDSLRQQTWRELILTCALRRSWTNMQRKALLTLPTQDFAVLLTCKSHMCHGRKPLCLGVGGKIMELCWEFGRQCHGS